jgi:site-specific DNA-methyltransferase (adenine-specific)
MLNDKQIRVIVDFEDSTQIFPGVSIAGGVCYFMWEKGSKGDSKIISIQNNRHFESFRKLNEFHKFIRNNNSIPILRKLAEFNELKMDSQVSSYRPFGLRTYIKPQKTGDIKLYWQGGIGPYDSSEIIVGKGMINNWKVISSRSGEQSSVMTISKLELFCSKIDRIKGAK